MRYGKDAIVSGGAVAITSLGFLLAGCGGLRWGFAHAARDDQEVQPATEAASDSSEPEREDEEDMLVKVEEFLARTESYQMPDGRQTQSDGEPPSGTQAPGAQALAAVPSPAAEHPSRERPDRAVANGQIDLADAHDTAPPLAIPVIESVTIRTPTPQAPPTAVADETNTSNKALDITIGDEPVSVERLLSHLETLVEQDGDIESVWRLRLAQLAFDRVPEKPIQVAGLSVDARHILDALSGVIDAARRLTRNPVSDGTEALRQSENLTKVFADRADPTVPTVALCRKVVTFGVYEEMPPETFLAGRTLQAIVYTEIGNFRSEATADGQYRTVVGTRLEIMTDDGQSVWQREEPEIVDLCRRQRRDFFIAQRITLPPTIAAGEYVLKVLAEDKLSGKATETVLPFTIQSPTSIASTG